MDGVIIKEKQAKEFLRRLHNKTKLYRALALHFQENLIASDETVIRTVKMISELIYLTIGICVPTTFKL